MLTADCANCFGLCCVVPAFAVSSDFAIDKAARTPCPNLQADHRCGIHGALRAEGFVGCTVYDCFGAGQQVSQVTFGGRNWRTAPRSAELMFDVFEVMRTLHEVLYYLTDALSRPLDPRLRDQLEGAFTATETLTAGAPDVLLDLDVEAHRVDVNLLLLRASEQVRAAFPSRALDHRGADLVGASLRGLDLRGASFRGALLIGADLRGADLRLADVIGADLRGADLSGADLRDALFLTRVQLAAAKGDRDTVLPPAFPAPEHWSS